MTTPGDPHRPHRREGGEDRPRDPRARRPAVSPDDPTTVLPTVVPDPDNPGKWVAGPGGPPGRDRSGGPSRAASNPYDPAEARAAGAGAADGPAGGSGRAVGGRHARRAGTSVPAGTDVPDGPIGATAYSVDSPELFPPLPEPERRRVAPPGPRPGLPDMPRPEPSRRPATSARPGSRRRSDPRADGESHAPGTVQAHGRWGEDAYPGRAAVASSAASVWQGGGPPPFVWPAEPAESGTQARMSGGGPGDPRRWPEEHGPGGPSGPAPGGYPPGGYGPWQPRPRRGTAAATTALVLGIASLLLLFVCGIGVITALVGIVVAIVALTRGAARGRALVGLVLSALTLLIAISFAAWLASTGVTRCLDETLYPTQGDLEACLEERLGIPIDLR